MGRPDWRRGSYFRLLLSLYFEGLELLELLNAPSGRARAKRILGPTVIHLVSGWQVSPGQDLAVMWPPIEGFSDVLRRILRVGT